MRLIKTLLVGTVLGLTALPALARQDIVWWDFLSGGDGVRMKALIDAFNKEHPDIQVKGTTLEWGVPFYTKVRTASAVGEGPDVMTYHLSRAPLALQEKVLSDITDKDLEDAGLKKDDFFSAPLDAATHDGKLYAVPFDIHALVLYYNADLLKGSPYIDAEGKLTGIKTIDDFEKALAWAKEKASKRRSRINPAEKPVSGASFTPCSRSRVVNSSPMARCWPATMRRRPPRLSIPCQNGAKTAGRRSRRNIPLPSRSSPPENPPSS